MKYDAQMASVRTMNSHGLRMSFSEMIPCQIPYSDFFTLLYIGGACSFPSKRLSSRSLFIFLISHHMKTIATMPQKAVTIHPAVENLDKKPLMLVPVFEKKSAKTGN